MKNNLYDLFWGSNTLILSIILYFKNLFSDSYLCMSSFSKMNFILNEYQSILTGRYIDDWLMIAFSEFLVSFHYIASKKECQASN